jgi:hypothetical protein
LNAAADPGWLDSIRTVNCASAQARGDVIGRMDGVLITRNVGRGAVVQPGKALLVLAPAGEVQA